MKVFDDKSILITGATGSFGRMFLRRLMNEANPAKVVVFSRDELKQFDMQQAYLNHPAASKLRFFLGDVRDYERLTIAFHGVDYVVHAAALKQVPAAEYNPFEFIKTNINGAENVSKAAVAAGVEKVVALSTDKACAPVNLYGATKLASDKIFVAAGNMFGHANTIFSVVRYGNVVGSRGSVVPLFRKLIDQGVEKLPITDTRMTRFWISLRQATDLVVTAFESALGGEIYVPKIPSMKVTDLAQAMAPNLPHEIIGIRPGEKLHEVMISESDAMNTVDAGQHYIILPPIGSDLMERYLAAGASQVQDEFSYTSANNQEILSAEQLNNLLREKQ